MTTASVLNKTFRLSTVERHTATIDGMTHAIRIEKKNGLTELMIDGKLYKGFVKKKSETQFDVWIKHYCFEVTVEDFRTGLLQRFSASEDKAGGATVVRAPMPGLVTAIEVSVGEEVRVGKGLMILEAMKMENELRAMVGGRIKSIEVVHNSTVEKGQPLLVIEPIR